MPRLSTRTILAVLISIGVVFAIYTSVQGASAGASRSGSHTVSGAMVNLNHDRFTVAEQQAYNAQLEAYYGGGHESGRGGGCESEANPHPDY